ncbi:unnamed protein product [Caenorhabditis sp. 36 PRJEB53466]|nr:unnamed protein product [Caenorhabditis sp. 36 PRJEB53466]
MDPFTVISLENVLQYTSLETRRAIAKNVPAIRWINKKLPYRFGTVVLHRCVPNGHYRITFDTCKWEFDDFDKRKQFARFPEDFKVRVFFAPTVSVIEFTDPLLAHLLQRRRTFVRELILKDVLCFNASIIPDNIGRVKISNSSDVASDALYKTLNKMTHSKIGCLDLNVNRCTDELIVELEKLETDHLKIVTRWSKDDFWCRLPPFRLLEAEEKHANSGKVLSVTRKFLSGDHSVGSSYLGFMELDNTAIRHFLDEIRNNDLRFDCYFERHPHKRLLPPSTIYCRGILYRPIANTRNVVVVKYLSAERPPNLYAFKVAVIDDCCLNIESEEDKYAKYLHGILFSILFIFCLSLLLSASFCMFTLVLLPALLLLLPIFIPIIVLLLALRIFVFFANLFKSLFSGFL